MIFCIKEVGRKGHVLVHLCWSRFGFSMPVRVALFWADISVTRPESVSLYTYFMEVMIM